MALFDYFPNYVWNLSVAIALESGGRIGEIMDMCRPIRDAAERGEDAGTGAFLQQWVQMADKLAELAAEDEAGGRLFSAGEKLKRAAIYYQTAERMQGHGHPGRGETYAKALDSFQRGTRFAQDNVERVEIPYEGKHIAGLFTPADGLAPGQRAPVLVQVNGLDSTKEMKQLVGLPQWMARRGVSSLVVDDFTSLSLPNAWHQRIMSSSVE